MALERLYKKPLVWLFATRQPYVYHGIGWNSGFWEKGLWTPRIQNLSSWIELHGRSRPIHLTDINRTLTTLSQSRFPKPVDGILDRSGHVIRIKSWNSGFWESLAMATRIQNYSPFHAAHRTGELRQPKLVGELVATRQPDVYHGFGWNSGFWETGLGTPRIQNLSSWFELHGPGDLR